MSDQKGCSTNGCTASLSRGRYDCTCGCGKSWCVRCGHIRMRAESPGQKSFLVAVPALRPGQLIQRMRKRAAREWYRINEAFWAGAFECVTCGVDTNNGECTGCMHGTSTFRLMLQALTAALVDGGTSSAVRELATKALAAVKLEQEKRRERNMKSMQEWQEKEAKRRARAAGANS